MQNKANFKNAQMNTSAYNRMGYGNFLNFCRRKNKAKQSQNEPNFSPKLALFFQYWLCFPQFWLCNSPTMTIYGLYLFINRMYSYRLFKQIKKQSIFHKLREVRENGL